MKFIQPITDRTSTDITNRTAKAFMNVMDWARIYNNAEVVKLLVEYLNSIVVDFTNLSAPTITTIPTVASINALVENIEAIRRASGLPMITGLTELKTNWLAGSNAVSPDYKNVNSWEKNLRIVFNNIARSVDYRIYCGVTSVGQMRFYQARWRVFAWTPDMIQKSFGARFCVGISGVAKAGQARFYRSRWREYALLEINLEIRARFPRTTACICGSGITRQNNFRRYI